MRRLVALVMLALPCAAAASDVGVPGTSLSLQRKLFSGTQRLKSVQKSSDVHLGPSATPVQLSGRLEIFYVDTPSNRGVLLVPAPWTSVKPSQAKYKNTIAPAGPTAVSAAMVKAGKQAQISAKGLGGFDLSQAPGAGGIVTIFTLENAAGPSTARFCTKYAVGSGSTISHQVTASGYSLKAKRGVPTTCPNCSDGVQNGSETAIDCGGSCTGCGNGSGCGSGADCLSGICTANVCSPASCTDGQQNGDESGVDCGGSVCDGCDDGGPCNGNGDCASGVCSGGFCAAPACDDTVKNGAETDLDCGGGTCPACAPGDDCGAASDCTTGICSGSVCQEAACTDGVQNGNETGIDCGWTCPGCADGGGCLTGGDCQSGVCTGDVCQAPACDDGVLNGMETDYDCGGPCPACDNGSGCGAPADCLSGVCTGNVCQAPLCTDGVANGFETDTDCGGPTCADCPNGDGCQIPADCQSGVCAGNVCQAPSCIDGVRNGTETDTDCGGPSCGDCGVGDECDAGSDCQSGVCIELCQAPTCADGVKNGTETDVDCGGVSCPDCAINELCLIASDCASNFCTSGHCKCPAQTFTFTMNSNNGGVFDSAEWPGGTASLNGAPGCSATINRPNGNIDLVCSLSNHFSVNGFVGYSSCAGTGGEDGDGCQPVSCPPAGVGSCCTGRPSCSAALNGSGSARYFVQCNP